MKITIIGGGNIGTLMAAELAYKGHEVTIFTSRPKQWESKIDVYNAEEKLLLTGTVSNITASMKKALEAAEYILITMPAQLFSDLAEKMLPFVHKNQKIGIVPGSGGAEFAFYKLLYKGCTLFGFQRVHSIARLKKYGNSVYQLGRKSELQIGAIPAFEASKICKCITEFFDIPCVALDNYLAVTLTPSNSILHTARLYSLFKNYKPGDTYPRNFLFYEEWTDDSSEVMLACDTELQKLCDVIPLDLSSVKSLKNHYECTTINAMTKKISTIKAFRGLTSPMKKTEYGWVPDWDSRYFSTDFPYGLKIIKDIAKLFSMLTPNIDMVWNWYKKNTFQNTIDLIDTTLDTKEFIRIYK